MTQLIYRIFICSVMLAISTTATAKIADKQPITIQSDTAQFDQKTKTATHTGNVILKQGDKMVIADVLTIQRGDNGKIVSVTATGNPAKYDVNLDGSIKNLHGQANIIEYHPETGDLMLKEQAELIHKGDKFTAPQIKYNLKTQTVTSNSNSKQRSTIMFKADKINKIL